MTRGRLILISSVVGPSGSPGTSGHSTPVTVGAVLKGLTERRTWLTRRQKPDSADERTFDVIRISCV